jgi:DNA-binding cell septation regulator SpoVG
MKRALLVFVGVVGMIGLITGCGSTPKALPVLNVDAGALTGKTALIIPLTLAERVKPKGSDTSATGLIGIATDAGVVSSWIKTFDKITAQNEEAIAAKLTETHESFVEAYQTAYNTTLVDTAFDFGTKSPALTFFAEPDKKTTAEIVRLCAAHNADYAITLLYRITDGPIVSVIPSSNTSVFTAVIVIFDKTGQIVAMREGQTPQQTFRFVYSGITEEEMNDNLNRALLDFYDKLKEVVTGFARGITTG